MEKKNYSAKERKAYYMGIGAAIGFGRLSEIKKVVSSMTKAEKESFYNGFDDRSTRQKRKGGK